MTGQSAGPTDGLLQCTLLYLWVHSTLSSDTWWWSTDPAGQTIIPTPEIENTFSIGLDIEIYMYEYHIPQQMYAILWDIHKACELTQRQREPTYNAVASSAAGTITIDPIQVDAIDDAVKGIRVTVPD
ncbi:hypothetical protein C8J56DRAFT_1174543 [Mycena floridula]|nr:hypothetical protein C8J56DRAFT_1174543 [Mycena floridula]